LFTLLRYVALHVVAFPFYAFGFVVVGCYTLVVYVPVCCFVVGYGCWLLLLDYGCCVVYVAVYVPGTVYTRLRYVILRLRCVLRYVHLFVVVALRVTLFVGLPRLLHFGYIAVVRFATFAHVPRLLRLRLLVALWLIWFTPFTVVTLRLFYVG